MPEQRWENERLADLVRTAVASGQRHGFRELVEQTQTQVYRVAYRVTESSADAEDVVQQTYIRACQALDRFHFRSSVGTWLCRIAINLALDLIRRQKRRPVTPHTDSPELGPHVEELPSEQPDPEDQLLGRQMQAAVQAALHTLKPKHRLVLTLREIDGLACSEIAETLGCALGTVESRLHRARKALRKKLKGLKQAEG